MTNTTPETKVSNDPVNHPKHYTEHPSGVECIQITEHMGFNLGNAVKYAWRCDLKKDAIEDLKKARWYIDREIAKREKESEDRFTAGLWKDGELKPEDIVSSSITGTKMHVAGVTLTAGMDEKAIRDAVSRETYWKLGTR